MEDDLLRSDGSMDVERTAPGQFRATISLPLDEEGMLARECPAEECSPAYFKIDASDEDKLRDGEIHCPYCRHADGLDQFATSDQVAYAKSLVTRNAHEGIERMMQDALGMGSSGSKTIGGGLLSVKMSMTSPPRPAATPPQDEEVRRDIACSECGLKHAVFGLAVWCPSCGADVFLVHVDAELDVLSACIDASSERREELGHRVGARDLENALEDIVSVFEAAMKFITRRHLVAQGLSEEDADTRIKSNVGNSFQNIQKSTARCQDTLGGHDLLGSMAAADVSFLESVFEKRHPLTHNLGVIDKRYLHNARSGELPGREIRVTDKELSYTLGLVRAFLQGVYSSLFPGGATPPTSGTNGTTPRPTLAHGTGLTDEAFAIASLLARESEDGSRFEPCFEFHELVEKTGLSQSDIEEAVDELLERGFVNEGHLNTSHPLVCPTNQLYYKLDSAVMGWNTRDDALELVKLIAKVQDGMAMSPEELEEELRWGVRRMNPACNYLEEMGWTQANKFSSGGHYEVGQFCPTPRTRRVAKKPPS